MIGTRGLTPLNPRARTALLKSAGVAAVDKTELEEARAIRDSRRACGCRCKQVGVSFKNYCD